MRRRVSFMQCQNAWGDWHLPLSLCAVGPHRKREDSQQCWPSDDDIIAHIFRHRIGSDHTEWNLSRGMRMSSQKSLRALEYADVVTISVAKNGCDASDLLEKPRKELRFGHQLLTRSPCTKIRRARVRARLSIPYHASNSSYWTVSLWLHRHHEQAIGQSLAD